MAAALRTPLERAWERTQRILLRPFNLERWIVLGFAAFLAGLGGGRAGISWRLGFPPRYTYYLDRPWRGVTDFFAGPVWLVFGGVFAIVSVAIGLALLWVSSRGKFIFLDNLLHERGAIVEPWKRLGNLGNSLFLWRLGLLLALLFAFAVLLSPMLWLGHEMNGEKWMRPVGAATITTAALLIFVLVVVGAAAALFLESFLIPVMYRGNLTALEACRSLLPLLQRNAADFLIYAVLVFVAVIALALAWAISWIATCCILPLLLWVPLVSTLLLLPLHTLFRLYSVEFLGQFGPEWTVAPHLAPVSRAPET